MGVAGQAGADLNYLPEIDNLCQKAWLLHKQGELDKAISAARYAMEQALHPLQVLNSCAALGWFLIEKGDLAAAEVVLIPALRKAPDQTVLHWRVGVLHQRMGNLDQAELHIERALAIDPSLDEAAANLAWVLHDRGKLSDACLWVRHALARRATPERLAQLGWFLLLQGKATQAIPLFQESLETAPQIESTHVQLGRALIEVGLNARALQVMEGALARFPNSQALLLSVGWQYCDARKFSQVKGIAERVIALQSQCANAWLLLGLAEQALGNTEKAITHFRHTLKLDATAVHAAIPLASYLRDHHHIASAQAVVADALHHHPDESLLRQLQAQLALDVGDVAWARRQINQLIAKDPTNGRLWHLLTQTLQIRHRIRLVSATAQRSINQLVRRCPDLHDIDVRAAFVRPMSMLQRIRTESRDLIELIVVPGLAAILPWAWCFAIFRRLAHWRWLYRAPCEEALKQARNWGWSGDEPQWLWERRLVTLVDHADHYLGLWRSDAWMQRHMQVSGDWPRTNQKVLLTTFHWGPGYWALRHASARGLRPHALVASLDSPAYAGRTIMTWYGRSRIGNVARTLGAHNIDIALNLKEVILALRSDRALIGLVDIPADEAKVGQPIELLGQAANVPRGLLRLIVDQQVPVVLYVTSLNTTDGSRHLSIQSIGVYDTVEEVARRLFQELDQLIRTSPAAWHFWAIAERFFVKPASPQPPIGPPRKST